MKYLLNLYKYLATMELATDLPHGLEMLNMLLEEAVSRGSPSLR
jgi:hypothetical protein